MDDAGTDLAALAQGVGEGLHEGVAVGDVERPASVVSWEHSDGLPTIARTPIAGALRR